jgi:hypothetical protein
MLSNNRKIEIVGLTANGIHADRAAGEIRIILGLVKDQLKKGHIPPELESMASVIVEDVTQKLADDIRFYGIMSDTARELLSECSQEEGFDVITDVSKWSKDILEGRLKRDIPDETKSVRVPVE